MQFTDETLRILDAFALRTRRSFFGIRQGAHRSQRRGHGVEFAEYRKYEVGDNPRAIDWGLFARSDKLYVKRYLEEENVSVMIVVDASRSLTHETLRAKWDLACSLTACISYVALAHQDPVAVSILGGSHSPTFWGGRAFASVQQFLHNESAKVAERTEATLPSSSISLAEVARRAATRARFPGICVVLSDFLYPVADAAQVLGAFAARNMEVHALQLLSTSDISPCPSMSAATVIDSETSESVPLALDESARAAYSALLQKHFDELQHHCHAHQIQFTRCIAGEQPLQETAIDTLARMGLFV
jgi:uncharacterized protein (DUF58 family)